MMHILMSTFAVDLHAHSALLQINSVLDLFTMYGGVDAAKHDRTSTASAHCCPCCMWVMGMSPSCHLLDESECMQSVRHISESHVRNYSSGDTRLVLHDPTAGPKSGNIVIIVVTVIISSAACTGAERRAHAQEGFMPHHWASPTSATRGQGGLQAAHWHPAAWRLLLSPQHQDPRQQDHDST